jgi:uncharacterized radical SAM superfamily Fe-S cluster-containing enzyme
MNAVTTTGGAAESWPAAGVAVPPVATAPATGFRATESLCPICLRKVPATLVPEDDSVVLEGCCPEHGPWRTVVWVGLPSFDKWVGETSDQGGDSGAECCGASGREGTSGGAAPARDRGSTRYDDCPGECGLCSDHGQHTCTAVFEVTRRCNLSCPVCFADSSPDVADSEPSVDELSGLFCELFGVQGAVNVQLSGGEPTMRDDLPEVIEAARAAGFTFVQLNTNGLRLTAEPGYAESLREAGLESVFLQFDGLTDDTYRVLRGRPLLRQKLAAVERCAAAGLGVVLVPTVVAGVNDGELGGLVRFAAEHAGVVRGLHLQPVSYFGRYEGSERPRLTMPEVIRSLESQTGGAVQAGDFRPSSCEHTRCSFRARYWVRDGGRLELLGSESSCCSPPSDAARRAVAATSRQWRGRQATEESCGCEAAPAPPDSLARFLEDAQRILCISGMLFQDAWSVDLERIRRCCVHSVVPGRGMVPFCLWNLTGQDGRRLYPRNSATAG